jgi:hypothetical protein
MGLLDDAIREHLELKRRRGADPGEIALQEHAALDPVYRAEDAAAEGPERADEPTETHAIAGIDGHVIALDSSDAPDEIELREDAAGGGPVVPAEPRAGQEIPADPASPQGDPLAFDQSVTAQETAEIDMEAVLTGEDERDGPQGDPLGREALSGDGPGSDWEIQGDRSDDPPPEPIPGQERMSFE